MIGNAPVGLMTPKAAREPHLALIEAGLLPDQLRLRRKLKFSPASSIVHCFCSSYGLAGIAEATTTLALVVPIKPVRVSRTPRRR